MEQLTIKIYEFAFKYSLRIIDYWYFSGYNRKLKFSLHSFITSVFADLKSSIIGIMLPQSRET